MPIYLYTAYHFLKDDTSISNIKIHCIHKSFSKLFMHYIQSFTIHKHTHEKRGVKLFIVHLITKFSKCIPDVAPKNLCLHRGCIGHSSGIHQAFIGYASAYTRHTSAMHQSGFNISKLHPVNADSQ